MTESGNIRKHGNHNCRKKICPLMSSDDERGIRMPVFRPAAPPAHPCPSRRTDEPSSGTSRQSAAPHGSNEYSAALEAKIARQAQELGGLLAQLEASTQYATLCERRLKDLAPAHPLPVQPDHLSSGPPPKEILNTSSSRDGTPLAAPCCVAPPRGLSGVPAYAVAKDAAWRRVERECAEQIYALKGYVRELDTKNAALAQQLKRTSQERDHRAREAGVAQRMACHLQQQLDELQQRVNEGGNNSGSASTTANKNPSRDCYSSSDVPRAKTAVIETKEISEEATRAGEASQQQASADVSALKARVAALEAALELKASDLLELDTVPKAGEEAEAPNSGLEALTSTAQLNGQTLEELAAEALGETEAAPACASSSASSPPPPPARRRAAALLLDHARLRGENSALTAALAEARAELAACKQAHVDLEARNADLSKELSNDRVCLQQLRSAAEAVAAGPRAAAAALAEAKSEAHQLETEKQALLDYVQESVDQGAALKENARRTREELEASKLQVEALKIEVGELQGGAAALKAALAASDEREALVASLRASLAEAEARCAALQRAATEHEALQAELLSQLRAAANGEAEAQEALEADRGATHAALSEVAALRLQLEVRESEAAAAARSLVEVEASARAQQRDAAAVAATQAQALEARAIEAEEALRQERAAVAAHRPAAEALDALEAALGDDEDEEAENNESVEASSTAEESSSTSNSDEKTASLQAHQQAREDKAKSRGRSSGSSSSNSSRCKYDARRAAAAWCESPALQALSPRLAQRARLLLRAWDDASTAAAAGEASTQAERKCRAEERAALTSKLAVLEVNASAAPELRARVQVLEGEIAAAESRASAALEAQRVAEIESARLAPALAEASAAVQAEAAASRTAEANARAAQAMAAEQLRCAEALVHSEALAAASARAATEAAVERAAEWEAEAESKREACQVLQGQVASASAAHALCSSALSRLREDVATHRANTERAIREAAAALTAAGDDYASNFLGTRVDDVRRRSSRSSGASDSGSSTSSGASSPSSFGEDLEIKHDEDHRYGGSNSSEDYGGLDALSARLTKVLSALARRSAQVPEAHAAADAASEALARMHGAVATLESANQRARWENEALRRALLDQQQHHIDPLQFAPASPQMPPSPTSQPPSPPSLPSPSTGSSANELPFPKAKQQPKSEDAFFRPVRSPEAEQHQYDLEQIQRKLLASRREHAR